MAALALDRDGVLTLQYALKRAIETIFQLEPNEVGTTLMGDAERPNILLFENAEGSLGVLQQFVRDIDCFHRVVKQAEEICRFEDEAYRERASYADLLSYYNQRDHQHLNRFLIRDALTRLQNCTIELPSQGFTNYDSQYQDLLRRYDQSSSTERKLLDYLYQNGLRLPDTAQERVPGIYCQPDFCYLDPGGRTWVFCDGTPHDAAEQQATDQLCREALLNRGDEVLVYYYKDKLPDLVARHAHVFKKVR